MIRTHITKSGESMQRLAARYYGRWELWRLILDTNEVLSNWKEIEPGLVIDIPDPKTEDSLHRIARGETYESISQFYYGTEHFSNRIRLENGNIPLYENIGGDILIPRLMTKTELELAKRRMDR